MNKRLMMLCAGLVALLSLASHSFSQHPAKSGPDPWIHDDQAIVVNVKNKGLVVPTGCGHAGVVSTLKCARTVTGVDQIHAVIGGFHLTGPIFEPIVQPTVQALRNSIRAWSCRNTVPVGSDALDRPGIIGCLRS